MSNLKELALLIFPLDIVINKINDQRCNLEWRSLANTNHIVQPKLKMVIRNNFLMTIIRTLIIETLLVFTFVCITMYLLRVIAVRIS